MDIRSKGTRVVKCSNANESDLGAAPVVTPNRNLAFAAAIDVVWTVSTANHAVTWTGEAGRSLDWGTMYHFEFVANAPPGNGAVQLVGVATASEPELPYTLDILTPQAVTITDRIFADGFD